MTCGYSFTWIPELYCWPLFWYLHSCVVLQYRRLVASCPFSGHLQVANSSTVYILSICIVSYVTCFNHDTDTNATLLSAIMTFNKSGTGKPGQVYTSSSLAGFWRWICLILKYPKMAIICPIKNDKWPLSLGTPVFPILQALFAMELLAQRGA